MSHVILARVLKLFSEFEAEHGDAEASKEKSREVARLEAQLGFVTQ
jgi:polyhydroxyalkanoate synthesis regulator protein